MCVDEGVDVHLVKMDTEKITSMRVHLKTLERMRYFKSHEREPDDSMLERMINFWVSHENCKELSKPMTDQMKELIKGGLESKFWVKCTKIEDLGVEGTRFVMKGNPKGTPVLIPRR